MDERENKIKMKASNRYHNTDNGVHFFYLQLKENNIIRV